MCVPSLVEWDVICKLNYKSEINNFPINVIFSSAAAGAGEEEVVEPTSK